MSKTEICRVCLLVDCPFRQNRKCPTDVTLRSAGTASVKQLFQSILVEQQVSNKCSTLFWWNSKCLTNIPLHSSGTAYVQQFFYSILVEQQVSNKCCTLFCWNIECPTIVALCSGGKASVHKYFTQFWWNSKCPTHVPLYSTGKAGVQQVCHTILLEQQVSKRCPTLFYWIGRCPTSVPIYSTGTAGVQQVSHSTFHRTPFKTWRTWGSRFKLLSKILSGSLQCVVNFHILPQATSLISSLRTSCKTHRLSNTRQTCWCVSEGRLCVIRNIRNPQWTAWGQWSYYTGTPANRAIWQRHFSIFS